MARRGKDQDAAENTRAVFGGNSQAGEHLQQYIERYENVQEEISGLRSDAKDILAEAKGNGFDVKVIKDIVKIRKQDQDKRAEHEAILETYLRALGMR